jgi:hypothetical protein
MAEAISFLEGMDVPWPIRSKLGLKFFYPYNFSRCSIVARNFGAAVTLYTIKMLNFSHKCTWTPSLPSSFNKRKKIFRHRCARGHHFFIDVFKRRPLHPVFPQLGILQR